ncbi:DUF3991 and TOPRIM domain-containing protein [Pseudoramibacter alactolyticus]|uniref:DUF3991 and TOPRIM domain-containing protein n=1 Tax=Pseudoramibacter alactolyticus TaxID=113287 RepID=UPI0028E55D0E|nr:DUF3991 and TOPRIM domain-containing protein [Pseudoramibacter alactolyticus]
MPYIAPEVVLEAKKMDLLTYLQNYEPQELVKFSSNTYCTRDHDSLKISNGKWYWFSRGVGGRSALDYLIKVRGMSFLEAVERIAGKQAVTAPRAAPAVPKKKALRLPEASPGADRVIRYLTGRGIDRELIRFCLSTGRLYESLPYHSAVFIGMDRYGKPRYASLRGTGTDFKGEASGSDKRFSFSIPAGGESDTLHLFESAIDLLSYATLRKEEGADWRADHLLSLAGVYRPRKELQESSFPLALKEYLGNHSHIQKVVLRLDNDSAGRLAAEALTEMLSGTYEVLCRPAPRGKDYNEYLCIRKGINKAKDQERSDGR